MSPLRALVLLALLLGAASASAAEPTPPPAWLPPTAPADVPRLQQKLYVKHKQYQLDLSGQYLWRADFYYNPAVALTLRYFATEDLAAELSATRFISSLQGNALEVREKFGFVPDSHKSEWLVRAGARYSVGYGKLLFGRRVIHVEPQVGAHLALLIGDAMLAPGFDLSAGFLVHWTQRFHSTFEVVVFPHLEKRSGWTPVLGVMPSLGVGVGWRP